MKARKYLKNLRLAKNMTQAQVSDAMQMSQHYYSLIEAGERQSDISLSIIRKLNEWALGLLTALRTALQETDWDQISDSISLFLSELDWRGIAGNLVGLIRDVLSAAWTVFSTLWSELDFGHQVLIALGSGFALVGSAISNLVPSIVRLLSSLGVLKPALAALGIAKGAVLIKFLAIPLAIAAIIALIRYRTGDMSRIIAQPCPCGSIVRRFDHIANRGIEKCLS